MNGQRHPPLSAKSNSRGSQKAMKHLAVTYGIIEAERKKKKKVRRPPHRKPPKPAPPINEVPSSPETDLFSPAKNTATSDDDSIPIDDDPVSTDDDSVTTNEFSMVPIPFEPIPAPICTLKQIVLSMCIGENSTELKMTPKWFEQEDQQEALKGIVYPSGITEQRPFDSVARYRAAIRKKNNFQKKPIESSASSTETLIVALDKFTQQFGGDLSFTNKEVSFEASNYRAACGIANLGSVHLLATNHIPTARFVFNTTINYKNDLAKSEDTMQNFILSFATAIAEVLRCENDYVRVFSVDKNDDDEGNASIDFGITTPEQVITEFLADDLEDYARSGFRDNRVLKYVKSRKYSCEWMPLITYLQLQPLDFATKHNYGYTASDIRPYCYRGGYPYNIPIGWYRHSLDISKKYPNDDLWLGCKNIPGEWPLAFHGTQAEAVSNITKDGLSIDQDDPDEMREEAVKQMGSKVDKPGLYLSTHCKGGAHPLYTKTFTVYTSEKKIERFRVVFQCRVKPDEFTVHKSPLTIGETWRVVDPSAVRPYGILVRRRTVPKYEDEESESDDEQFR